MVYGLFKLCWLTHVTCKCFKETALLFNVHLSCFANVGHHSLLTKNNKRKTLDKTPESSPLKRNLDEDINDSKSHIWNSFFENIISSIQSFYIRPQVPVELFFNFQIFKQKVSKPTETSKKKTHCTIQFRSKNLTQFTNLNSFDIENNMLPQHSQ